MSQVQASNPFKQQFVTMKFPENSAGVMSIESFNLQEDEFGLVDLPRNLQGAAEAHGLYVVDRAQAEAESKAAKKAAKAAAK